MRYYSTPLSLLLFVLSATPLSVSAQNEAPHTNPIQESDQIQISSTQGLSGRIAFSAKVGEQEKLFVLDLTSKKVAPILNSAGANSSPSYSPDGSLLAFVSTREGTRDIYIAEFDGQHPTRITKNSGIQGSISWSSDGSSIVFGATVESPQISFNIFSVKVTGGAVSQITNFKGSNLSPEWAPNGEVLAYATDRFWPGNDICAFNIKDRAENCLLTGSNTHDHPRWSHSGKLLAYSFGAVEANDVGLFNLAAASRASVSALGKKENDIAWSPDDKTLIFTAESDQPGTYAIYLSDLTDRTSTLLRAPFPLISLSWSGTKTLELEARRIKAQEALANSIPSGKTSK